MTSIIQSNETIDCMYARLLIRLREIDVELMAKKSTCQHCKSKLENHLNDLRCSVYSGSHTFLDKNHDEKVKIIKAITFIEEIRKL
jgi:hypothetical protein